MTNNANAKMSREQMRFQERMDSTRFQRSRADLIAAGLNPALAYGNPAGSPSGSTATMQDVGAAGINSAQRAREVNAALAMNREKITTERVTQQKLLADAAKSRVETEKAVWDARSAQQGFEFNAALQPWTLRNAAVQALVAEGAKDADITTRRAQAQLQQLLIPGARSQSLIKGLPLPFLEWLTSTSRQVGPLLKAEGRYLRDRTLDRGSRLVDYYDRLMSR